MIDLLKYKHIIWDWNGTIFNDVQLSIDIINKMLSERKLSTLSLDTYKQTFTIPVKKYYKKLGFDFSKEPFEIIGKLWIEEYEKRKYECSLHNEALKMLEKINKIGIEQSILSAYSQHTLEEMLNYFNIRRYFKHVVGLDNIYAAGKLHLGIELMKKIGNGKGEVLLIGDTLHDYEVAVEIGADCLLVANGHQSRNVLMQSNAKVIDSLQELI
ncbi:MAG: HAD family hydrolase [Melioribacter sp.]|nr:HAD family hydrolase [Melioribacter sp.]